MSSLGSVQVSGVRSFGPGNFQSVRFQSPLTLIVGQNGSGKTTLIECLRYICTGEMPTTTVGLSKNANFAHDLNRMKIECTTQDGVIMKMDRRTRQMSSVASKCADMNREMAGLLGVSDAVLNNVIFCHQEDSNWPLSEPKALKTRFDDIFSATKYMKALDAMRSLQKDLTRNVTEYKNELVYLRQFQDKAKNCRREIRNDEAILDQHAINADKIKQEIEPIETKMREIGQHRDEVDRLRTALASLRAEKDATKRSIDELRSNITEYCPGGIEQLKGEIAQFEREEKRMLTELNARKRDVEQLDRKHADLEDQKANLLTKRGKLDAEVQHNNDQLGKRDKSVSESAEKLSYTGFSRRPFTDENVADFLRKLQQTIRQTNDDMSRTKSEMEEHVRQAKTEVEQASNAVAANQNGIRLNQEAVAKLDKEIREVDTVLQDMGNKEARLTELSAEITRLEMELKTAQEQLNEKSLNEEILKLNEDRNETDAKKRTLHDELKTANQQNSVRMEMDMLQKDKTTKEEDLQKLMDKHQQALNQIFYGVDIGKLRDAVEDDLTTRSKQLQSTQQKLNDKKVSQKSKERERDILSYELKAKEKELRDAEDKIDNACKGDELSEELENVQESLSKLRFDKGTLDGSENVYKGYIRKLETRPCCPLCERNFSDSKDATNLSDKLKRDIRLLPDRALQLHQKIEEQQKRQADLLELKPVVVTAKNLKEIDIPAKKKTIDELNAEIKTAKKEITELETSVDFQNDDEQAVRAIQNDVGQMDGLHREIQKLQGRLTLKQQTASLSIGRAVDAIEDELSSVQMILDDIDTAYKFKQDQLTTHREKIEKLRRNVNDSTKDQLEITKSMQQRIAYEENRVSLSSRRDQHQKEIEEMKRAASDLNRKLTERRAKGVTCETEKDNRIGEYQARLQTLESYRRAVADLNESIEVFRSSRKSDQLKHCIGEIETVEKKLAELVQQRQGMRQQSEKQERNLNQGKIKLRDLNDSIKIKEKEQRIADLDKEIADKSVEFDRLGGMMASGSDYDKVVKRHAELTKRMHEIEGQKKVLEKNVREKRDLLESEGYKDADEKYKEKLVHLTTTEFAISDVTKYSRALDNAIIQYHSSKMEAINDVLREYWQKIYKHNDIDYIAIRSAEAEATDRRRAYNYRVVMSAGGTELDMRGRCSAGQKVLASVLIRIALAEVFSGNCGVLALDEPTTNLDAANIQGLAEALVELIELRSQQKNFQLILITHDEQFVRMLLQGYPMEMHYRVRKNDSGFSEIAEMTSSDLD